MKNHFIHISVALCCQLMFFSFQTSLYIHPFDSNSVISSIKYLSSDSFKGRLAGSLENHEVEIYIENELKNNQLLPYTTSYLEQFSAVCPQRIAGLPYLKVVDKNNNAVVKEYKYGTDYKEDLLNFRKNSFTFDSSSSYIIQKNIAVIKDGNDHFVLYTPENDNLSFRSSFMETSSQSMFIMVKKQVLDEMQLYINNGCKVECYIPYKIENTKLNNVIGVIKGKNQKLPPLILSAHFDHVGTDLNGNIYNGALDNASGVSFILEMSKYIKSLGIPDRDIIIAAFNGEELGLKGSSAFALKYKNYLSGSKVFNFDMIGSKEAVPLSIMGSKTDTANTTLVKSASNICQNNHIFYNYLFTDGSDHESFRKINVDALTFCDSDLAVIHTPQDTADKISSSGIMRCFKVSSIEVINNAYAGNLLLIYYLPVFFISVSILIVIFLVTKARKN
jgi:hypothetical protein